MKTRLLTLAGLCVLAVALALPAGGIAASPTVTQVKGGSTGFFSICGLDLTYDFEFAGVEVIKTSGVVLDAGEFRSIWANPATGESIVIHGAQQGTSSAPIDDGDGTVSFVQASNGTYIVKAANGSPITLMAGRFTAKITVDASTGDLVSVQLLSVDGPHGTPPADSSCDSIVAALT
jgi:hypothetical protein